MIYYDNLPTSDTVVSVISLGFSSGPLHVCIEWIKRFFD